MTYLTEMRDTVGSAAIKLGLDPGRLTEEQFQQALAEVDKAVKAGIPRSSPATPTSRTCSAATPSSRWPGPAT